MSPAAMPVSGNSPAGPGSLEDLQNRAAQAPQQLGQTLQNQQQPQQPQQPGWSPDNPHAKLANYYAQQVQQAQPPAQGGNVKRMLTNFFSGMGESMLHEAGLQTPDERRQILVHNAQTYGQLADQWEQTQNLNKYRAALTDQMTQNTAFQQQLQPVELQRAQLGLQQEQQAIPTVRPSMTAADLASLGVPSDLAAQYAGKPLSAADMGAIRQMTAVGAKQLYDYGQDGQGEGKGIWLVDKQYNPVKQLSPISETSRSTALAKQQMQLQLQQMQSGQTGIDIVEGRLDPSQISPRSPQYPFVLNAANQYSQSQYGQPFDFAKASSDYKFASNPQTKNTLNYLNSLTGSDGKSGNLAELVRQSDAIGRTQFPAINDVAAWTRLQAGNPAIASYKATITEISDQVAKILQGGGSGAGTSDAKMKQANDLFYTGFSADQIKGVASALQPLLQNRKTQMIGNNTYLQRWYSPKAAGANAATQPTAGAGFNWNSHPVATPTGPQ